MSDILSPNGWSLGIKALGTDGVTSRVSGSLEDVDALLSSLALFLSSDQDKVMRTVIDMRFGGYISM